jgi:hypothetical protein
MDRLQVEAHHLYDFQVLPSPASTSLEVHGIICQVVFHLSIYLPPSKRFCELLLQYLKSLYIWFLRSRPLSLSNYCIFSLLILLILSEFALKPLDEHQQL